MLPTVRRWRLIAVQEHCIVTKASVKWCWMEKRLLLLSVVDKGSNEKNDMLVRLVAVEWRLPSPPRPLLPSTTLTRSVSVQMPLTVSMQWRRELQHTMWQTFFQSQNVRPAGTGVSLAGV